MDRTQLTATLRSGRALALDCHALARLIPEDDPIGPLFKVDLLNETILYKQVETTTSNSRQSVRSTTRLFFPYDLDNAGEGGESLRVDDDQFYENLLNKIADASNKPVLEDKLRDDLTILRLIHSLPSLDPFLFKSKVEQSGLTDRIHPVYCRISRHEWAQIQKPIQEKIQRLVEKSLQLAGVGDSQTDSKTEMYVQTFLRKIMDAKDVSGIEPFLKALRIEPEAAPDIFFAWKAICYYQVRFLALVPVLKSFFKWFGNDNLSLPSEFITLRAHERDSILELKGHLRARMRESYQKVTMLLAEYDRSYDLLIEGEEPEPFKVFLWKAHSSYITLATHVSLSLHVCGMWRSYISRYGERLRLNKYEELVDAIADLYGTRPQHSQAA